MTKIRRVLTRSALVVGLVLIVGAGFVARSEAHRMLTNPVATRKLSSKSPTEAPWRLPAEAVEVKSADGTTLRGWFVPADSPRLLLLQHGYKTGLQAMFGLAGLLHRHGYQVMIMCVRGHDRSEGEVIRFGQGGADRVVSPGSGQKLFEAAKEPKQFWFEPALGHTQFLRMMPDEFEQRVVGFFDAHLK